MAAALRTSVPYVLSFHSGGHSSHIRGALRGGQAALLRPLAARAASLVAVSRFEASLFGRRLRLPPSRIRLIPNGADTGIARPPDCEPGNLIVSIGRLERYKGHQHAVRALPHILATLPDARLVVVGTGPYEHRLRALEHELGVADRVAHLAFPSRQRQAMADLIASASVVVLFSEYEAYSVAALEAAALGRQVVAFNDTGLAEAIEAGFATGVAPRASATEIAAAIIEALRSPRLHASAEVPTWDDCAAALSTLYWDILSAGSEHVRREHAPEDVHHPMGDGRGEKGVGSRHQVAESEPQNTSDRHSDRGVAKKHRRVQES
jgi:glycosyltransferase involved in cell wall biosynthesis